MKWKILNSIALIATLAFAVFIGYGVIVDCPNTSGFVSCAYKFRSN